MNKGSFSVQWLLPPLSILVSEKAIAQSSLKLRSQLYDEEAGRIDVESHYLDFSYQATQQTKLGLRLAIDSLSGMTPVGTHAPGDPTDWEYQLIEDERYVSIVTIDHEIGNHTLSFEYARSEEDDYLSNAMTLKLRSELFDKNTTITGGISVGLDKVIAARGTNISEDENKDTVDLSLGISQLLGTQTILDFTLGYGHSEGYLADPYRQISEIAVVFGNENTFSFPENRPDEQDRWVAKLAARHYFVGPDAALAGSYRFFSNSDSIEGHTFDVKWIQQINKQLSVTPYLRYYQQSRASFYTPTLTGTGIPGHGRNDGVGPFYSSDYRVSAFDAWTYGLRLTYEPTKDLTFELQYERYEMSGETPGTPSEFFPTANVISLGTQWTF